MVEIPHKSTPQPLKRALVIEDVRLACADLRMRGYHCDRMIRNELMTHMGTECFGRLRAGDRVGPRWQKIHQMIMTAT